MLYGVGASGQWTIAVAAAGPLAVALVDASFLPLEFCTWILSRPALRLRCTSFKIRQRCRVCLRVRR